jgi:hypothetical protein
VLGLAWARAVGAMATQLQSLPTVPVVRLTGAMYRSPAVSSPIDDNNSIDVVPDVPGWPVVLPTSFAPFLVHDAATATAMRRQPTSPGLWSRFRP